MKAGLVQVYPKNGPDLLIYTGCQTIIFLKGFYPHKRHPKEVFWAI